MIKKYHVTSRNIIDTTLSYQFVEDIQHCERKRIPIALHKPAYMHSTDIKICRADGKLFQSGRDFWTHNNNEYDILGSEYREHHLPEELFKV